MAKKVLILTTGGTIVSPKGEKGAAPDASRTDDVLHMLTDFFSDQKVEPIVSRIFGDSGVDSSDLAPKHWVRIAKEISAHVGDSLCGVLIVHGTDTMAYTAAWLALCFDHLGIPIILTGSQCTPSSVPSDGPANLLTTASMVMNGVPGVWISFNWKLHKGGWAHKKSASHIDAFTSQGESSIDITLEMGVPMRCTMPFDAIARDVLERIYRLSESEIERASASLSFFSVLPGRPFMTHGSEKILILYGFGAGNIPQSLHAQLETAYPDQKPFIIACSQAELGEKNPVAYRNVGIGNLASKGFSVWNQGTYTIEFITVLAHAANLSGDAGSFLSQYLKKIV